MQYDYIICSKVFLNVFYWSG